ncbi:hypothetical protein CMI47_19195 [Candidatus Pacearchaeota archaeon]|nr:hypothetical protein [Candidatus Pacearchaeota archaeon]|tara:strand:+ start:9427 stop:10992 length:1566 start_codon:yes stop_codon:yes gene_type:complete
MKINFKTMKITKTQLRRIIRDELINEAQTANSPYFGDDNSGQAVAIDQQGSGVLSSISGAIDKGDHADESIRIEMRRRAINDFSSLYVAAIQEELKVFIVENPGISGFDDLSTRRVNDIKVAAARRALSKYKGAHTNTELISDYTSRVERLIGKPIPPTLKQLMIRYAKDFAYQFVFGFLDNVILILAGAAIDDYIKIAFGAEKLKRVLSPDDLGFITDGIGNAISDGVGDIGGGAVERGVDNWAWLNDAATDEQLEIATPFQKLMAKTATFTGVILGCLAAIPIGILILKGLTTLGVSATAGIGLAGGVLSGGLGLVTAALMTKTTVDEFNMLDSAAKDTMNSALGVVMSRLYKEIKTRGNDSLPPRSEYTLDNFTNDVEANRALAQLIWNDEMDFSKLASHHDINYNEIWRTVDALSSQYGLDNPNVTSIDECHIMTITKNQLINMICKVIVEESNRNKKHSGHHPEESYEVGTSKNLMLDRPTQHGGWPEGPSKSYTSNKPVNKQIYDWLKSMAMIDD